MAKVTIQLGEEDYRIVVDDGSEVEEGDLAEYGEQATLDTHKAHYLCLIEDPDTEPNQVEVTVRLAGKSKQEPVVDVEVIEAEFQGGDGDQDEDDLEDDEDGAEGEDDGEDDGDEDAEGEPEDAGKAAPV